MPALQPHQIADLVTLTLRKFIRNKWVDISLDLQKYIAMSRILGAKKTAFDGGEQLQWQIQTENDDNARNTGLWDTDQNSQGDLAKSAVVPWTFQTTNWGYDDRENAFQSSMERIVSLIKMREHSAMNSLAKLMERNFFETPSDDSTPAELLKPYGLKYWIVRNATEGFTGQTPSGHTNVAGLSAATNENWRNYSASYATINKTDLVRKWRKAATFCNFMPPDPYPEATRRPNWSYLTNYNVIGPMEEALEAQNMNLGNDVASKDGALMFRRNSVDWVPYLEADTQNPIYGIDWGSFDVVFKRGEYMKRTGPIRSPDGHRLWLVHVDSSCQFRCLNRRGLFVLYNSSL